MNFSIFQEFMPFQFRGDCLIMLYETCNEVERNTDQETPANVKIQNLKMPGFFIKTL